MSELDHNHPEVRQAAVLLDERRAGWYWQVATERIRLESQTDCIGGQVFGSFSNAVDALDLHGCDPVSRAFMSSDDRSVTVSRVAAWVAEIDARRRPRRATLEAETHWVKQRPIVRERLKRAMQAGTLVLFVGALALSSGLIQ